MPTTKREKTLSSSFPFLPLFHFSLGFLVLLQTAKLLRATTRRRAARSGQEIILARCPSSLAGCYNTGHVQLALEDPRQCRCV